MKPFRYDVIQLMKCVRDRPVIWDKTMEIYKDRVERKQAWDEIFRTLDEGFDEMTPEEQRITGETIINKWTNSRDTFIKSLRTQSRKLYRKPYVFHKQMSFLLKVATPQGELETGFAENVETSNESDNDPISYITVANLKQEAVEVDDEERSTKEIKLQLKKSQRSRNYENSSPERDTSRKKRSKKEPERRRSKPESLPADFVEVNEVNDPRVMNEDEAFFASLLPTVAKYSEDERLAFRIEVLAVMKGINDKRRHQWTDVNIE